MNNLKRVLSLALASVMLIGMMVVGASAADFTDADEIQHQEAVDVLVALGIVNGKEDGSYFAPNDNVTRGEMAKMIAVAMMGGNDINTGTKGIPSFTDIGGHWAESYIEYCYDMGIIAGRGDGTFDPNANVTGTEVTKMVLSALGYDAEAYKLTGATWATRTDELARIADPSLYDELVGVVLNTPATRDNAAQIIWNGLQNETMKYEPTTNKTSTGIEWTYKGSGLNLLEERYNGKIWIGKMVGNYDMGPATNEGEITVYGKIENSTNALNNASFPSDLSISNIGEEVKVIFKDGTNGVKNVPDNKDTIYGVFNTGATQVYWTTRDSIKTGSDAPSATDKIKFNGTEYTVATTVATAPGVVAGTDTVVTTDYGIATVTAPATGTSLKATFEGLKIGANPDKIKFVTDDNGKISAAYVETQYISYVTAVSGDKVTLNGVGTIKISENDIYDDVAKFDVVNYTKYYKTNKDDAFYTVTKAEAVTGEMTAYKNDGKWVNVSLDGKTYKFANKPATIGGVTIDNEASKATLSDNDIGEEFTAYLVGGFVGSAYLFQKSDSANNLAVVKNIDMNAGVGKLGDTLDAPKVELLLADGTKVTAVVDEDSALYNDAAHGATIGGKLSDNGTASVNTAIVKGDIVRYSVTSSGTYKITEITTVETNGYKLVAGPNATDLVALNDKLYSDDTKSVTVDNGTTWVVTSGDCVLFIGDPNAASPNWKVYKIRDLDSFTAKATAAGATVAPKVEYVVKDGKAIAMYVETADKPSGAASNTVYGIVSTYSGTVKVNGDSYKKYIVENDADEYTLLMPLTSTKLDTDMLVSFEPTNDDTYKDNDINIFDGSTLTYAAAPNNKGLATWVKEYNAADKTLTYYSTMSKSGNVYTGGAPKTVALDDDVVISYVNVDDGEAGSDIGISEFNSGNGYRNVLLVPDVNNKIVGILVESSGEADIMNIGLSVADQGAFSSASATATTGTMATTVSGAAAATGTFTWYGTDSTYTTAAGIPTGVSVVSASTVAGDGTTTTAAVTFANGLEVKHTVASTLAAGTYYYTISFTTDSGDTFVKNCKLTVGA